MSEVRGGVWVASVWRVLVCMCLLQYYVCVLVCPRACSSCRIPSPRSVSIGESQKPRDQRPESSQPEMAARCSATPEER